MPHDEALRESMELYRRRAKAYRVAAEGVSGECLRIALSEVARSYDLLVTSTKQRASARRTTRADQPTLEDDAEAP